MKTNDPAENSASPSVHSARIRRQLGELIEHLKADGERVDDPHFRALTEVSAEILKGMSAVFADYDEAREKRLRLSQ